MANTALSILLLHGLKSRKLGHSGVSDAELDFPRYDTSNHYVLQSWFSPVSSLVASDRFDAVFVTSTFMDAVVRVEQSHFWRRQYEFLRSVRAVKVAFPQDDYWFSEARDFFYAHNSFDAVFPVCPPQTWPELIPQFLGAGGEAFQGQTVYVTPRLKGLVSQERAWDSRANGVVYRATRIPKVPNRIGHAKGVLGETFLQALASVEGLEIDIGGANARYLLGREWPDFLGNSRATLGSSSGSSVLLRNREVFARAKRYLRENPGISGAQLESIIFPAADRGKSYTAIAPRNVEAAALGVLQLLTPGEYGGFMLGGRDYFQLAEDCSNAGEAVELVRSKAASAPLIASARQSLIYNQELRFEAHLQFVIDLIRSRGSGHLGVNTTLLSRSATHHRRQAFFEKLLPVIEKIWGIARRAGETARKIGRQIRAPR